MDSQHELESELSRRQRHVVRACELAAALPVGLDRLQANLRAALHAVEDPKACAQNRC